MTWLYKTWLRVLALAVASTLAVIALVSLAAAPLWPVIGVTFAAAALVWKGAIAPRITRADCLTCGADLRGLPTGEYGLICKQCGSLNEPIRSDSHGQI